MAQPGCRRGSDGGAALLAGACLAALVAAQSPPPPPAGAPAPALPPTSNDRDAPVDLTWTDRRWLSRSLAEMAGARATVVFVATIDCPIVRRYLPRVQQLAFQHADAGVRFVVLNVGDGDALVDAAAQQVELAPAADFAKDFDGSARRALGVERTATAVVLDAERRIVYRGRIDQQYRYAGTAPTVGRPDLQSAIADLLEGREVAVATTVVEGCLVTTPTPVDATAPTPTWTRDVAPLLRRHCQDCHRQGDEGPFGLLTFEQASRHRAMLGEAVAQQRMPPWYGSRSHGGFVNARGLTADERATIARWVAAGGPRGASADAIELAPLPPLGEWRIGEPDLVLEVPAPIRIPAEGYLPYRYFVLPYRFHQDTWIEAIEIRSADGRVLHHCNMARVKLGERFSQDGFVTGQVPGGDAMVLDPGTAVRIPAGSALALQAHYVTVGEPVVDRLSVGLRFPRVVVDKELRVRIVTNTHFSIPRGAGAHEVRGARELRHDAIGIGVVVHMHLRGRDMTVRAIGPDGEAETLLVVPNYNFDWQQSYRWGPGERRFARGTRIEALAHYDNSAANPFNPDPTVDVRFGLQTVDEMMYAFLFHVRADEQLGLRIDPSNGRVVH